MPGFEVIDEKEKKAVASIFDEGKVFFAHGFDNKRKRYHVREFENRFPSYIGLGLYWEYEGTLWLQNTCHNRP